MEVFLEFNILPIYLLARTDPFNQLFEKFDNFSYNWYKLPVRSRFGAIDQS